MLKILCLILMLIFSFTVFAKTNSQASSQKALSSKKSEETVQSIRADLAPINLPSEITVGDELKFKISFPYSNDKIHLNFKKDDIAKDFKILEIENITFDAGQVVQHITVSPIASGTAVLSKIDFLDENNKIIASTDEFSMSVKSILKSENEEMADIVGPQEIKPEPIWYVKAIGIPVLIALILAFVIIYFIRKRKPKEIKIKENIIHISPFEIVVSKMFDLEEKKYLEHKEYKKFAFELTEIAKEYLHSRLNLDIIEATTSEFKERTIGKVKPEIRSELIKSFESLDITKFTDISPNELVLKGDFVKLKEQFEIIEKEERAKQENALSKS